jgi:hypothetical protein
MTSKTVLFAPAPIETSLSPIKKSRWGSLKSSLIRNSQIAKSAITGVLSFTDYHHVSRRNVNRGDIAISVAIKRQLQNELPAVETQSIGWDDVGHGELQEMLVDCSRVVIGGGGYIFLDSSGNLNARRLDLDIFERFQGEVIAHGIGLNRLLFENPWTDFRSLPMETRNWLRRFAERCKYISVRDAPSVSLFGDGAGAAVDMVGDPALSLGSEQVLQRTPHAPRVIGINTASHGTRALFCLRRLMPHLEYTYRNLARQGYRLKYFVHDDADYSVIRYLKLRGHGFEVVDGSPEQLVEAYKSCSFVINQMLHSSILAFSAGVPCIGIAYDLKSVAFFEQFGLGDYCLQWNEVNGDCLNRVIMKMINARDENVGLIVEKADALVKSQVAFVHKALR